MTPPNIPIDKAVLIGGKLVSERLQHPDYKYVVDLAADYKRLITGKDMEPLYKRYDPRESEADLKQAIAITNPITPAICAALSTPLLKLANVPAKIKMVKYEGDPDGKKATEMKTVLDGFNGGNDLDSLFRESLLPRGLMDPNAFALYTFENFDHRYAKPDVFVTIQSSEDVWNFEYHSNILQWLFLHKTIKYQTSVPTAGQVPTFSDGDRFILYTPENHIVYTQRRKDTSITYTDNVLVDENNVPVTKPEVSSADTTNIYFYSTKERLYEVTVYAQRSGRVPAFRLGYKRDPYTLERTMVNHWHAAMPHLLKLVKLVRENDLSFVLHAILQKFIYVPPCTADGCTKGYLPQGTPCPVCKASGKATITTSQDSVELALPPRMDMLFDLEKLVHYVTLPTDILKIQMENIDVQSKGAWRAVYNSDIFISDSTADTATGQKIDMQSVYDAVQPASGWYSSAYMESGYIIATYKDVETGLTIVHAFPRDFHYESQDQLLERITKAKGVVSNGLLSHMQSELVDLAMVDDPFGAMRVKTMTRLDPFLGRSDDAVTTIISQGLTTKRNKVLWGNMPYIIDKAEAVTISQNPPVFFYDLPYSKQVEVVDGIIEEMILEMDEAVVEAQARMTTGTDPEQAEDGARTSDPSLEDDGQGASDTVPAGGQPA